MSKLTESFQTVRVFNSFEFYGHGRPYIAFAPRAGAFPAKWQVHRPGFKTDPDAHWGDHGSKTFSASGKGDAVAQQKALDWASERYGIKEWKRDPFGSYGETEFVDRRVKELKAAVREQAEDRS